MGARLSKNLLESDFRVSHIEPGAGGRARLKDELGIECVDVDTALDNVGVVILAIPDTLIGRLAHEIAPKLKPRTMAGVSSTMSRCSAFKASVLAPNFQAFSRASWNVTL